MITKETYLDIKNEYIPLLGLPIRNWVEIANELGDHDSIMALLDVDTEMTQELQDKIHGVYARLHPDVQQAVAQWDTSLIKPKLALIINKT